MCVLLIPYYEFRVLIYEFQIHFVFVSHPWVSRISCQLNRTKHNVGQNCSLGLCSTLAYSDTNRKSKKKKKLELCCNLEIIKQQILVYMCITNKYKVID